MSRLRVLLLEPQLLFRRLLAARLAEEPDFLVVGELGDGRHAVEQIAQLRPHVVVSELQLQGQHAVDVIHRARSRRLHARFVVLTAHPELTSLGLLGDAAACLAKNIDPETLCDAIRRVARVEAVPSRPGVPHHDTLARLANQARLSPIEQHVLRALVGSDLTLQQTAAALSLELETSITASGVKHAMTRVIAKLGVHPCSRSALIKRVLQESGPPGDLEPNPPNR